MRERQNREFKVMVYLYPLFAGSILATVLQLPRSQQHSWCGTYGQGKSDIK